MTHRHSQDVRELVCFRLAKAIPCICDENNWHHELSLSVDQLPERLLRGGDRHPATHQHAIDVEEESETWLRLWVGRDEQVRRAKTRRAWRDARHCVRERKRKGLKLGWSGVSLFAAGHQQRSQTGGSLSTQGKYFECVWLVFPHILVTQGWLYAITHYVSLYCVYLSEPPYRNKSCIAFVFKIWFHCRRKLQIILRLSAHWSGLWCIFPECFSTYSIGPRKQTSKQCISYCTALSSFL